MTTRDANRLTLVGTVGAAPDTRENGNGELVAYVSVSTVRDWVDASGATRARTDWHRVTFRAALARLAEQYLRDGSRVYIEGRIEYGCYDRDGTTFPTADVVAHELVILA